MKTFELAKSRRKIAETATAARMGSDLLIVVPVGAWNGKCRHLNRIGNFHGNLIGYVADTYTRVY